jgi:hypothetical protein
MGQWGPESCSCDSCFDVLDKVIEDTDNMLQKEVDNFKWPRYDSDDLLGCVIWFLAAGKKVPIKQLKQALVIAERRLTPEVLKEEGWRNKSERIKVLGVEIEDIKKAMKNKGRIAKRKIPGLFN